jgi:hypothetical protein
MFIIVAAPLFLSRARRPHWDGLAAFFAHPVLIARAIALCVPSGVANILVRSFCPTWRNGRRESRNGHV